MNWISVEDELPGEGLTVLIYDGSDVWAGYLDGGLWYYDNGSHANVTHWQELPEWPK